MATQSCCTRLSVKLGEEQRNLVRLARLAAYHDQKSHKIENLRVMIADSKVAIAALKLEIEEHDAEHAGQVVA
jgi:2-phospho-L-lactate guanylyltransferase (CobY/MobA/RfbA family)